MQISIKTKKMLTRNDVLGIIFIVILNEPKSIHKLNFHNVTVSMLLKKVLNFSLSY